MATIQDSMLAAAALWVLDKRLTHHIQNGEMLQGLQYDEEGEMDIEGESDLPLIQPFSFNFREGGAPGAKKTGANLNTNVSPVWVARYRVAGSRREGWFRKDPTNDEAPLGLVEWVALIVDAMETSLLQDGEGNYIVDAGLENALERPMTCQIDDTITSNVSFTTFLDVELPLRHQCRGDRSATFPH